MSTPAAAFRLSDEELANLWNLKERREIVAEYGLNAKHAAILSLRVSRLRKQGWKIRKQCGNGAKWTGTPAT